MLKTYIKCVKNLHSQIVNQNYKSRSVVHFLFGKTKIHQIKIINSSNPVK